jgi:hypothetical protein
LVSDDLAQFHIQFGKVGDVLLDWHAEHGSKAKHIELTFFCKPWLQAPIEKSIKQMLGADDLYGFLHKVNFDIVFFDLAGRRLTER